MYSYRCDGPPPATHRKAGTSEGLAGVSSMSPAAEQIGSRGVTARSVRPSPPVPVLSDTSIRTLERILGRVPDDNTAKPRHTQ